MTDKSLTAKQQGKFYVYHLMDPLDGAVFYVGKGSGGRAYAHEALVRSGRVDNAEKCERIARIVKRGDRVAVSFVAKNMSEPDAYGLERSEIQRIGLANLTNIDRGSGSKIEQRKAAAKATLLMLKPFDKWCSEAPRTAQQVSLVRAVIAELVRISHEGYYSQITVSKDGSTELA